MYYVDFLSYLEQCVLFLACQSPSENGSKLKEFATKGSKFFPFRVNHFQEEAKPIFYRVVSLESVPLPWRCRCLITFEACQVKTCLLTCTFSNPAAHMQSIIWSFSPFIHSVVSNNSFNGQRRPWSDCQMRRLIGAFAARTCQKTHFHMTQPIYISSHLSHFSLSTL